MNAKKVFTFDPMIPFDHSELMRHLSQIQEQYPFLEMTYLGTSLLDRGIPTVKLGHGRRKVLYVGTHHGMEWMTAAILTRFLSDAADAALHDSLVGHLHYKSIFETHTLYILPMLNPDGAEYQIHGVSEDNPIRERLIKMNGESEDFSHWQANARGVDLNRNYDAGFEEYRLLSEKSGIFEGAPSKYQGSTPESEPEVHALCNFIRYHEDLLGVMTLHTQGREIYYKSQDRVLPRTEQIAKRLSRMTSYKLAAPDALSAHGGLTDWCIAKRTLPSFTLECGYGENPLPFSDFPTVYREVREALFTFPILL